MNECKYETDEITNHGYYYTYRGQLYIKQFPEMWATSHAPETGPEECNNCAFYGSWNGIFIGYCVNCAEHVYEFQRGHGFIDHGEELNREDIPQLRAMDTYLWDVDLDKSDDELNTAFYYVSSSDDEDDDDDDDDDDQLEKLKEFKKNNRKDDYYTRKTPVSETTCCSLSNS